MKNVILYFFLTHFLTLSMDVSAQWIQKNGPFGGSCYFIKEKGNQIWTSTDDGVYISEDEGYHWNRLNTINSCDGEIVSCFFEGDSIYMLSRKRIDNIPVYYAMYHSYDNGNSWSVTPLNFGIAVRDLSKIGDYFFASAVTNNSGIIVRFQPGGPETIIAQNDYFTYFAMQGYKGRLYAAFSNMLQVSEDFGDSWTPLIYSYDNSPYLLIEDSLIISSENNGVNYISHDLGQSWDSITNMGNHYTVFQKEEDGTVYGLGDSIKCISYDNGYNWTITTLPIRNFLPFAKTTNGFLYVGMPNRCDDNGMNNIVSAEGIKSEYYQDLYGNGEVLLIRDAYGGLHTRSLDGGLTWEPIPLPETDDYSPVFLFKGDTILYQNNDRLYYSANAGSTWLLIYDAVFPDRITGIEIDKNDIYILAREDFQTKIKKSPIKAPELYETLDLSSAGLPFLVQETSFLVHNGALFLFTLQGIFHYEVDHWTNVSTTSSPLPDFISIKKGSRLFHYNRSNNFSFTSLNGGETWIYNDYEDGIGSVPTDYVLFRDLLFGYSETGNSQLFYSSDFGISNHLIPDFCNLNIHHIAGGDSLFASTNKAVWEWDNAFQPGIITTYLDDNFNGYQDSTENNIPFINLIFPGNQEMLMTNELGIYEGLILTEDTLRPIVPNAYFISHPPYYVIQQGISEYNFGLQPFFSATNGAVSLNSGTFNSGELTPVTINYKNIGSLPISGKIILNLDSLVEFESAIPPPNNINVNTLMWNIDSLPLFNQNFIHINFRTDQLAPISTPINLSAEFLTFQTDIDLLNNYDTLATNVSGTNSTINKTVEPAGLITPDFVLAGQSLDYLVRFQNTGNSVVTNVIVLDTLDESLDINTLEVVSSSHAMTWTLLEGRILRFFFQNINLPDASADETGSQGFLEYTVACKMDLPLETEITNAAHIYMDEFYPISTNRVLNFYDLVDPVFNLISNQEGIYCFPNPTLNEVFMQYLSQVKYPVTVQLYSISGDLLDTKSVYFDNELIRFDLSNLPASIYILRSIESDGKYKICKIIKN